MLFYFPIAMRLLHAETFRLVEFSHDDPIPEYAILSHTWGANGDEVTIKDLSGWPPWFKRKPGWAKIKGCCRQARTDGIEYVWIDTCCLDRFKGSETSVGDEIQSMWEYYSRARVCYVHLADVHATPEKSPESPGSAFERSRWFTRGWTVPELLAPLFVRFYDASWKYVGSKAELSRNIEAVTGIGAHVLRDPGEVARQSVACRMSWVAFRETSREEDIAYCLLGIFGVRMPVEYGEGRRLAFERLQREILRSSGDQSLFAWGYGLPLTGARDGCKVGMLAETPAAFQLCGQVEPVSSRAEPAFVATATGLQFQLPMKIDEATGTTLLNLECRIGDYYLVLPLDRSANGRQEFERRPYSKPMPVPVSKLGAFSVRAIKTQLANRPLSVSKNLHVSIEYPRELALELAEVYPPGSLHDVRPATANPAEGDARFSLYLSDLPWAMLSVQDALGHKFLISLERGDILTKSGDRDVVTQIAAAPASCSLSGPQPTAAFSLIHLLPMFASRTAVVWSDVVDIGGLLVRSNFRMPGSGNELRRVKITVGSTGSRPLSALAVRSKGRKKR